MKAHIKGPIFKIRELPFDLALITQSWRSTNRLILGAYSCSGHELSGKKANTLVPVEVMFQRWSHTKDIINERQMADR